MRPTPTNIILVVALVAIFIAAVLYGPRLQNKFIDWGVESVVEDVITSVVHIQYTGEQSWQGSGVIISEDGVILTARHVCKHPGKFTVTLSDGREFVTEKTCVSREYDVGYLKITASDLPAAKFGDSDKMGLGSGLLAIGSPWGKVHFNSVTKGILSADNRNYSEDVPWGWGVLFQTDVAANPGNSGGPVFNMSGELVGIVVGLYGPGSYAGITYCVPSNICKSLVESARATFALREIILVEVDKRIVALEVQVNKTQNKFWDIEWRISDIEWRLEEFEKEFEEDEYTKDEYWEDEYTEDEYWE